MDEREGVCALLAAFQEGYSRRDLARLDAFMRLFREDCVVIGTAGVAPGEGEWYLGREEARAMIAADWASWGDLRLELEGARIGIRGGAAWISAAAAVTRDIGDEGYRTYLAWAGERLGQAGGSDEDTVYELLRSGLNTVFELRRGERFVWPLRFTAVAVRETAGWLFAQMHFAFPTTRFPDVRLV